MKQIETETKRLRLAIESIEQGIIIENDNKTKMETYRSIDWLQYAKDSIKTGLDYARKRFIDVSVNNIGRGSYEIKKGLQTTKAFNGAQVFDPSFCYKMTLYEVKAHLDLLINFNFVSQETIDATKKDAEIMHAYMIRNHTLPDVNIMDHRVMMKGNEIKKEAALARIKKKRRGDRIREHTETLEQDDIGKVAHLLDNIFQQMQKN